MKPAVKLPVQTVLILKADRLYAELLRQYARRAFPRAKILTVATIEAAALAQKAEAINLLIADVDASLEGDLLDLLSRNRADAPSSSRVLVVTADRHLRVLGVLRELEVDGVFDSLQEPTEQLVFALQSVATGGRYWSPSVLLRMQRGRDANAVLRYLTVLEQLVLSVIGSGCDDTIAAQELSVSPATIATVRRDLHRKLGVQHRGELVRIAAQYSFVRFTADGVLRPGYAILLAAYHARRPRRVAALSSAVAAEQDARPAFPELALPAA